MASSAQKKSLGLFVILLILGPLALLFLYLRSQAEPKRAIRKALEGYPDSTVRYWTAVSAFETNGWTSRVFKDGNNLFGMKLAKGNTTAVGQLEYGEGQAIFPSVKASAEDIRLYMEKRFKYPRQFNSLKDLIYRMKERAYFEIPAESYYKGVEYWYNKLYGN